MICHQLGIFSRTGTGTGTDGFPDGSAEGEHQGRHTWVVIDTTISSERTIARASTRTS